MSTSERDLQMQKGLLGWVVGLGVAIALAGPIALYLIARQGTDKLESLDAYSLPILLIGGIVMFLVGLCLVVIVFRKLGLASTSYALGLPEGSIRAFIALALILLFFMMGVYLYAGISEQDGEVVTGLTPTEANAIPEERVAFRVTRGALVDVHLNPNTAAGEDVARQMITTMSTLVVAIASFYFGTSAVQQALTSTTPGGGAGGPPSLTLVEPQNMPRSLRRKADDGWEPETIRVRSSPPDAHVDGSVEGDVATSLAAVDDSGAYTYTPVGPAPAGVKLKFVLAGHKDVAPVTIEYLVPPGGEQRAPGGGEEPGGDPPQPVVEQPVVEQPVVEQPVEPQPEEKLPDDEQPAER